MLYGFQEATPNSSTETSCSTSRNANPGFAAQPAFLVGSSSRKEETGDFRWPDNVSGLRPTPSRSEVLGQQQSLSSATSQLTKEMQQMQQQAGQRTGEANQRKPRKPRKQPPAEKKRTWPLKLPTQESHPPGTLVGIPTLKKKNKHFFWSCIHLTDFKKGLPSASGRKLRDVPGLEVSEVLGP